MKETYYLNQDTVPTIPVPHDCVIKDIRVGESSISFIFEDDISQHDSIKSIRPGAKSLIVTFHLLTDISDATMFVRGRANRLLHRPGAYKEIDDTKLEAALHSLAGHNLAYLYHNVGYCSLIIHLWAAKSIVLDLNTDYVLFEWVE